MRDLEELRSLVIYAESRLYFDEGLRAYQAGAYRAAIVEIWVAVSLDLIGKIRYLAESGDKAAVRFIKNLDDAIHNNHKQKLQKSENDLLDKAKELELLTSREYEELMRLNKDRNVCAHPAFISPDDVFKPNSEQVRAHLASAVDNALSLPPISGRKVIEQFKKEVSGPSWPACSESEGYVESRYLNAVRESVKRGLIELIIKTSIEPQSLNMIQW